MFVFAAASWQLDDRCGLFENLAAAIENEVVVGGDLGEGDRRALPEFVFDNHSVLAPVHATLLFGAPKVDCWTHQRTEVPKVVIECRFWIVASRYGVLVNRGADRRCLPITNRVALNQFAQRTLGDRCALKKRRFFPHENFVFAWHHHDPNGRCHSLESLRCNAFNLLTKFCSTTTSYTPRMAAECRPWGIRHADVLSLTALLVNLLNDGAPYQAMRRIIRRAGLTLDAHHRAHASIHRLAVAPEQNDGWRAMAWDVCAARVHHVREVQARQHLLD